jgi:hypothetical protein
MYVIMKYFFNEIFQFFLLTVDIKKVGEDFTF